MSFFYDEDTSLEVKSDTSFTKGERTGFREVNSAAYKAFVKSEVFTSERNNLSEEYGNMVNILQKAGHADMVNPLDQQFNPFTMENIDPNDPQFAKTPDQLQADFWNKVSTLQTTDENLKSLLSEAGLDTQDNMMGTISKKAHSAWKEYSEINERATTAGKIGGFVGMMGGAFTDPIMQLGVVASFGYSVPSTISAAALRVAYMEAIIGGVSETIIQLKAQPYRKELGFEDAGFETGLKNVAMVTGASAVLSPALLGVFKAFGKSIDAGKKLLSKTSVEDLQKINKEVGEKLNSKYKDKTLNDIEIPKKDIPDNPPEARTEHNERLNTAVKQFQDGEPVDLPPIKNKIIYHGTDKYFKEFDLNKTADQSIWFTSDMDAIKEGAVGAAGKGNIITRIIDENRIKLASGKEADKLTDDQLIAQGFDGVKYELTSERRAEAGFDDTNYRIFNTEKLEKTGSVQSKSGFNKNETKLAEDIEGVKNFDVPNEAAFKNQASDIERSMFDVSTSSSIKSEAGAGAAARTSPIELSDATQVLPKGSQKTDVTPVSVLANANTSPPLFRGSDTSKVGVKSAITNRVIYHISNDFNEIYKTLSAKKNAVLKQLQPIANKYNGELKARIKDIKELNKKLNRKENPRTPENISDYLGARISVNTINDAKLVLSDLNKSIKFIHIHDFLDDAGRVVEMGTQYRAIHAQVLTKDGFSFELQIRLKELDPLTEKSHATYKKAFSEKEMTNEEFNILQKELRSVNKKLEAKYFQIKDKEFKRLKSDDPLDRPIPIGQRFDEATGEILTINKTARELFEQEGKNNTMLERLKDCV